MLEKEVKVIGSGLTLLRNKRGVFAAWRLQVSLRLCYLNAVVTWKLGKRKN